MRFRGAYGEFSLVKREMSRFKNERGATLVEYLLILCSALVICIPVLTAISIPMDEIFTLVAEKTGGSEGTDLLGEGDPLTGTETTPVGVTPP